MYYKYLNKDRKSPTQNWQWPPVGTWTPLIDDLIICESGYHVCRPAPHFDLLEWYGEKLYEVEIRGKVINSDNKLCVTQARLVRECKNWNPRTQRLFACDCAARVLKIFEAKYPKDKRPREAIRVARAFANGKATATELATVWAAAGTTPDTTWAMTADATWASTGAARAAQAAASGKTTQASTGAACAIWDDEWDVAWAAGDEAAASAGAACAAEKKWQVARMMKYIKRAIT